ncbi:MAG: winged helix-turn-helix transcriptional regulator [Candidatus Competibacteraceae bacterium]|nr:MAG: winged helix-turn-helix transcriptional regulator [Candidatus Competibacteraceae bacterium]
MIPDELHGRLLRLLHEDPTCSQRALARALGISLGGTHYAVPALRADLEQRRAEVQAAPPGACARGLPQGS